MECPRTRGCELRWRTGRTLHDAALVLLGDLNQVSTRVVEHGCRGGGAHLKRLLSEEHPLRAKPLELLVALIGRVTDAFVRVRTAGCLLPRAAEMRPPDRVRRSACGGLTRRICVRRVPQNAGTGNRSARWMLKSFGFECPHGQHFGIGGPPSLKLSSTNPASANAPSRAGNGKCDAPTLSLSPLSVHDAFVQ